MVLLYGRKEKVLGGEVASVDCPNCNKGPTNFFAVGEYIHTYHIPLFPTKKKYVLHCNQCDSVVDEAKWPDSARGFLNAKKEKYPLQKRLFVGTFLWIFAFFSLFFWNSNKNEQRYALLNSMQEGDIVVLRQSSELSQQRHLWPAVVEKVTEEIIFIRPSQYAYTTANSLETNLRNDIKNSPQFFGDTVLSYPRKTLSKESVELVMRP